MQISRTALLGLLGAATSALALEIPEGTGTEILADLQTEAIKNLKKQETCGSRKHNSTCTLENATVRRDWRALSASEKTDYIDAVLCLMDKPSKADPSFAPGSRSRYDDFVAVHINQTLTIHGTGNFLTWHRYYVWAYEYALQNECGYNGTQPYWNWFDGSDFSNHPIFDGSDTSMSGDGEYVAHNGSLGGSNNIYLPSGEGGGCVKSGPFKDMVVTLGPVSPGMDGMKAQNGSGLDYNPRCLSRDLTKHAVDTWMTAENLWNLTQGDASGSISLFQDEFQGRFGDEFLGIHAAGHFTMGGDSADLFASPTDPIFWLHHSMTDRLYWLWQALHPKQAKTIAGTITILNLPPSRDALVSDPLNLGVNAPEITIDDALDTVGNSPFCYIYE
ncbi:unnamed protein product [Clonostachys byssicola]|uniref:Tyrosinase copper-binding domain-containing protein n=1 Tax=Clonostachys byssicola TaxID=160290 RepID=A0A9N9YD86_9HYPO|nr:unnamed protein product [Clonostachys byssicola]